MDWRTHRCTHTELHCSKPLLYGRCLPQFSIESMHHASIMHSNINTCCQNYVGLVQAEAV